MPRAGRSTSLCERTVPSVATSSGDALLDVPVFVASPEDTVVAKLEWSKQSGGSERQRRDVAGILTTLGSELDREYVERWVRDLDLVEEWRAAQATPI